MFILLIYQIVMLERDFFYMLDSRWKVNRHCILSHSNITQERHLKDKCIFRFVKMCGCFDVCLPAPLTCFLLVLTASPNPPQQITAQGLTDMLLQEHHHRAIKCSTAMKKLQLSHTHTLTKGEQNQGKLLYFSHVNHGNTLMNKCEFELRTRWLSTMRYLTACLYQCYHS